MSVCVLDWARVFMCVRVGACECFRPCMLACLRAFVMACVSVRVCVSLCKCVRACVRVFVRACVCVC